MKVIYIEKAQWASGLEKAGDSFRLWGPVRRGPFYAFDKLASGQVPALDFRNTRLSAKGLVYPQSEKMFEYTLDPGQPDHDLLKEAQKDYSPRAVLGIRPCDADAFELVARNFDTPEYQDPYWLRAREAVTLVGLACAAPCSTCFCTSAGSGPFSTKGLDILLVDSGGNFLAQVVTPKGEAFAQAAGWRQTADDTAAAEIETHRQAAEARITAHVPTDRLKQQDTLELHAAPFWDDVAFACINCGTCTYLCPTCWCFDIQDETHGRQGVRLRNWDSCMFPLFTLHGSGHNPRGQKVQRVRQRFMNKLKYYVDKYENGIQCVGCGRCVRHCPVNIDIRKVCELMNSYTLAGDSCAVVS